MPDETPDAPELTLKQRKWLAAYIETGNATEAARLAGYECDNEDSFSQIGWENLQKLKFSLVELMDHAGLTDAHLMRKLKEGMEATVVKTASDKGVITDEKVYTDYPTRHAYLDTALKLKGKYPAVKQEITGKDGGPLVVKKLGSVSMEDL